MNKERTEQIKIGLLALIAVLMIYRTIQINSEPEESSQVDYTTPVLQQTTTTTTVPINIPPNPTSIPSESSTSMNFENPNPDLGSVKRSAGATHTFKVTNTGLSPLNFSSITTDPGLLLVSKPNEPVPPGGTSEIVVKFGDDIQLGAVEKVVHIASNTEPPHFHLKVKAVIEE